MEHKSTSLAQERFGAFAQSYATSRPHATGDSLRRLVELLAPQPGWLALDIATGAGHMAMALAPHVGDVIASDPTLPMLAVARGLAGERGIANIHFAGLRAEQLPFADASFDVVTCRIAPHHFADVRKFVTEAARVLRPSGQFGLVDNVSPDASTTAGDAAALAAAADEYNDFERLRDPSHMRCLTLAEWRGLIATAGLAEIQAELIEKAMVFGPWADQQQVDDTTRAELRARLLGGSPTFRAFTRAEHRPSDLGFTLTEGIIVARK